MKSYDEILDEVAFESGFTRFKAIFFLDMNNIDVRNIHNHIIKEAAERYRGQVELPSDDDIKKQFTKKAYKYLSPNYEIVEWDKVIGAKWMRDHIKNQLNDKK